ncbi:MAG: single-stranded DNA-binding protein [Hydrogenophaga sp.]|nr:single-stranded DNA-binding protein [Hydrogenophaga sp.]
MASVNKVILVGNCGRDPEIRYLPSGQAVANVSIATSSRRKDKTSGETIEETQWHRVTFFDRLAEIAGEYLKKGHPVYIEGRLKYGTYVDKTTGVEKNTCDIMATEMQLLGSRDRNEGGGEQQAPRQQGQRQQQPAPQKAPRQQQGYWQQQGQAPRQQAPVRPAPQAAPAAGGFDDMDSDIPW